MICVDVNILIAAMDPHDLFHAAASAELVSHSDVVALNVTWAEALVHPHRIGRADEASELLVAYGVNTIEVTDPIAFTAARLRGTHGNRNFPMLDALVVAVGIEHNVRILTTDTKWPTIADADIHVLTCSER
jgi:predicted nucleic acid-binding protein